MIFFLISVVSQLFVCDIKDKDAQLILVANAANGESVKFSNWEEFFPIEYV